MKCHYACNSPEHAIARRHFLGTLAAGAGTVAGLNALVHPATAAKIAAKKKRILSVFLSGGVSQFESWDPKPGTLSGGPFRALKRGGRFEPFQRRCLEPMFVSCCPRRPS